MPFGAWMVDFQASQKRLKERAKAEDERIKAKAAKQRLLAERQRAREAAWDEEQRQRRLEAQAREEEQRLAIEHEREINQGVVWRGRLQATPAPESFAASKGIKRAADKILLPPSVGDSLLRQDAHRNGPYFFELRHASGRSTHAGLLEFSAAEGFVALPRKVARCLCGPDADEGACLGAIDVAYRRLLKGTRVVFQPRRADFQQAMGDSLREALEEALLRHSTLTVGDWIEVTAPALKAEEESTPVEHIDEENHEEGARGKEPLRKMLTYDLRVHHVEPADAVSVIDTELEAEVLPSVETEERLLAEEMEARRRMEEAAAAEAAALAMAAEQAAEAEANAARRLALREAKAAALPPEPPKSSAVVPGSGLLEHTIDRVMRFVFRFPDGTRHARRFLASQPLQLLFDFVDSKGASGKLPGEYRLVTQFPRRVFEASASEAEVGTLGLDGPSHVLFLEPIQTGSGSVTQ